MTTVNKLAKRTDYIAYGVGTGFVVGSLLILYRLTSAPELASVTPPIPTLTVSPVSLMPPSLGMCSVTKTGFTLLDQLQPSANQSVPPA